MSRYADMFSSLKEKKQGAFIPFVTIGDPSIDRSFEIICQLVDSGADALELGLPFSDPIADGPTIQKANIRALSNPITTLDCLALITKVRAKYPTTPIGLLLYSNLVIAKGIERFYSDCSVAGVDSILVADVPIRESKPFRAAAKNANIEPVFIVPPSITDESLRAIASHSRGYTYLLSRAGVTGAETKATMPPEVMVNKLSEYNSAPPVLGFGISAPNQVKDALNAGAAGAISGSAIVNIIEQNVDDQQALLATLGQFVVDMKAATTL